MVERFSDLATVGRTMMEVIHLVSRSQTAANVAWLHETRWILGNNDSIEMP